MNLRRRYFSPVPKSTIPICSIEHTKILMQPGETKDLFLTPGAPGTYDLRYSDHDWDGMVGGITVL